eukprot:827465_1
MEAIKIFSADSDDVSALINRIKYILAFHSEWMLNEDQSKEDIDCIINNGFGTDTSYNIDSFLYDYYFVVNEENKQLIATAIQDIEKEMKDKETDTICDAEICRVIDRVNDIASHSRRYYFRKQGAVDDPQATNRSISVQQILDSLHMFMYHTIRVNEEECIEAQPEDDDEKKKDDLYEDKITQKISALIEKAQTSKRFRRTRNTSQAHNKFMTMNQCEKVTENDNAQQQSPKEHGMDDLAVYQAAVYGNEQLLLQKKKQTNEKQCVRDQLCELLCRKHDKNKTNEEVLTQFATFLADEEYDTDAITDDLKFKHEEHSNLKRTLCDWFEAAALFVHQVKFEEDTKRNVYDAGFRFFYWPFYQDKEDQRRLVSKLGRAYTYEGNNGYKLKDWFIAKKYANLKEELTQNTTKPFDMDTYDGIIDTASLKLTAYQNNPKARRLTCRTDRFHETYGIEAGTEISLNHIVAVLCYTNYSKHCYEFSRSFRRISPNESDESLKQRHGEFYHWARALRECVECFGVCMADSSISFFYHGISRSMLLDSTSIKLCGPVSTTSQYSVAVGRFAENGIVLQIFNDKQGRMRFWPCSYWSCYSDEYEYLFIGGLQYFYVSTIRDIPNEQRYDSLIRAMNVFHYMVDGYPLQDRKVTKKDVRVLRSLVHEEENNTLLKASESSVPVYFLSLFHHFLNTLAYIDIELTIMDREVYSSYYAFKLLVPIFCLNEDPYSLNYALLLSLMPNIKSFTVWNSNSYHESVELNNVFVSSMTEAMSLETQCHSFYIVNPSIPGSTSLTDFINEKQETFTKFGWRLERDSAFKHPRRRSYDVCSNTLLIKKL